MTTTDTLRALVASIAAAGYPTALTPTPAGIRPCVSVLPPTIQPLTGVCPGPRTLTVPVRITGAGVTVEQITDLYDAVDDVLAVIPSPWAVTDAEPDPTPDTDPAYLLTVTREDA